MLGVENI